MTGDRRPQTGRSLGTSSAELEAQRRAWGDAGRQVWDAATRTGRNVLARTRSELEALGRAHLEAEALRRQQDQVVAKAATGVVRTGVRAVRPGSATDPGPGRLFAEWATGLGPEQRMLGPDSSFSQEFAQAPSVQQHLKGYVADWRARDGGLSGRYVGPRAKRAVFGPDQFLMDLDAGNGASHFVGSWGVQGEARGDRIDWRADNDTDTTSLLYGNPAASDGIAGGAELQAARAGRQDASIHSIQHRP